MRSSWNSITTDIIISIIKHLRRGEYFYLPLFILILFSYPTDTRHENDVVRTLKRHQNATNDVVPMSFWRRVSAGHVEFCIHVTYWTNELQIDRALTFYFYLSDPCCPREVCSQESCHLWFRNLLLPYNLSTSFDDIYCCTWLISIELTNSCA